MHYLKIQIRSSNCIKNYSGKHASFVGIDGGYGLPFNNINALKKIEWKEVKKPVSFLEAIKAFNEGRTIYCKYRDIVSYFRSKPFKGLMDDNKNPIASYEILEGEWYIED